MSLRGSMCVALACVMGASACGPETPVAGVPSASAGPRASVDPSVLNDDPGVFTSKRFGVRISLQDGDAWKIDDRHTGWLNAQKSKDQSSLTLRMWRGENRMNHEKCEAIARDWKKLPVRDNATMISHETIDLPAGFDTNIDVGLVASREKSSLFGFVLAFGGYAHKCFAYVFVTKDQGPGADERVAERLGTNVERTLKKIQFVSELAPDIEHAPEADPGDPKTPPEP